MSNKFRGQYMLSGARFEKFIGAAQEICKTKERSECRSFIKSHLFKKVSGKIIVSDTLFGQYHVLLLLQKVLLEKMIYGYHVVESDQLEAGEQLLLQLIFISPDEKTEEILSENIRNIYGELNRRNASARYKSVVDSLNEIITFTRTLIDEL